MVNNNLVTHTRLYKQAPPHIIFVDRVRIAVMGKEQQLLEAAAAGNISKVEVSDRALFKFRTTATFQCNRWERAVMRVLEMRMYSYALLCALPLHVAGVSDL